MKTYLKKIILLLICISLKIALSGCGILPSEQPVYEDTGFSYVRAGTYFPGIGTAVIFQPVDISNSGELSAEITDALVREIRKNHTFSIRQVPCTSVQWQDLDTFQNVQNDLEKLAMIRRVHDVNAVIFGHISHYEPFPRMTLGMRLRMLDLRTGRVIWGIEQEWDSTDKNVQQKMKCFYDSTLRSGYEPLGDELLRVSPRAFYKFIAYEIAQTIPKGCRSW